MADINPLDTRKTKGSSDKGEKAKNRGKNARKSRNSGETQQKKPKNAHFSRRPSSQPYRQAANNHAGTKQAYAAIDLGTNNCRLLIARPQDRDFVVIDAFSRVVRLGEGLAQTGELSQDAMDRALGALKICANKLRKRKVHLARSVATEACRRASNGHEFIERVRKETGISLDIIAAEEEARLAVMGCHILLENGVGPAVIFDIGGGSTELVLIEPGGPIPKIIDWQSVPWGVVSLSETVGDEPPGPEERAERYAIMKQQVADSFASFAQRIKQHETPDLRLLGTSGTVTTLASVHLRLPQYDRNAVDGLVVNSSDLRDISQQLSSMSIKERGNVSCIGHDRAELVVAGCAILEAILDIWPAPRLCVADRGIREGILRSLMSSDADGEAAQQNLRKHHPESNQTNTPRDNNQARVKKQPKTPHRKGQR